MLRTEIVALKDMAVHRAAWTGLAARCLEPCIFAEPAFALAAARHLAPAPGPLFVLVWSATKTGRRLDGLGIVVLRRTGQFAAAFSHAHATSAFPLLDRDAAEPALRALLGALADMPGRPAGLSLEGVQVDGPTGRLLSDHLGERCRWIERRPRAVLRPGTPLAMAGKATKEQRRQARRLAELGRMTTPTTVSVADMHPALGRFLDLESAGWKGRRGTAFKSRPRLTAFIEAALAGMAHGACEIDSLELDDAPLAMAVVLRSRDRAWFWKIAFSEAHARFSPGVQLTLALTARLAADPSLTLVDSCAVADHPMIDRLWPDRMIVGDLLVATQLKPGLAFEILVAAAGAYRGLRMAAKKLRDRLLRVRKASVATGRTMAKS